MDIVFAPAAAQDIEEIGDYIYAGNPAAAIRFFVGLRSRCSRRTVVHRASRFGRACDRSSFAGEVGQGL